MRELRLRKDWVQLEAFADECRNAALQLEPRIIVPSQAAEPSRLSRVVAVGPEVSDVRVGDIVLSQRYGGAALEYKGEHVFLMREENLLAKVVLNGKI
jgi:hypothetical protein